MQLNFIFRNKILISLKMKLFICLLRHERNRNKRNNEETDKTNAFLFPRQ